MRERIGGKRKPPTWLAYLNQPKEKSTPNKKGPCYGRPSERIDARTVRCRLCGNTWEE